MCQTMDGKSVVTRQEEEDFVFQVFIYPRIPILIVDFYRFYWKTLIKNVYYIVHKAMKF